MQILGGHWAVLQTVAWTSMLIDYTRTESFVQAVTKTFDGSRPCDLCKVVSAARQSEEKAPAKLLVKLEAVLPPAVVLPPPASTGGHLSARMLDERVLVQTPPVPPPRSA